MAARLNRENGFRLVCIVEPDASNHANIAALDLPVCESLEHALASHQAMAVILTSPNPLHEEQVRLCAAQGCHVFCEKPLALNGLSARRAVTACADAGIVLGIGHERRFEPALQTIKQAVNENTLGTLMHAEAAFSHDKLASLDQSNWRTRKDIAPAAGMTGMGIHLTDLFIWMFGRINSVQAMTSDRSLGWETGDVVSAQLRFESGMTATLSAILHTPHFMRFHVFGSEQWLEARNDTHPDTPGGLSHLNCGQPDQPPRVQSFQWNDTVVANLRAFGAAIRDESPYPYTTQEMVHNIEVLDAIAHSADSGRTVPI